MSNIQFRIEKTQVPEIIKLMSDRRLINEGSFTFANVDEAKVAPAVQKLFYLPFVKKVLLATNYIAIERYEIVEWDDVIEQVIEQLQTEIGDKTSLIESQNDEYVNQRVTEVYIESTPNPNVLKFATNIGLSETPIDIQRGEQLPETVFDAVFTQFKQINKGFVNINYIAFTKDEDANWDEMQIGVRSLVYDYLSQGFDASTLTKEQLKQPVETQTPVAKKESPYDKQIADILEEYVKPAVSSDGGDISFHSYDEGKVYVTLSGACNGCPSSTATLKNGIENILKEMLPDKVTEVVPV